MCCSCFALLHVTCTVYRPLVVPVWQIRLLMVDPILSPHPPPPDICLAHQMIARALSKSCVQNNASGLWEVRRKAVELTRRDCIPLSKHTTSR